MKHSIKKVPGFPKKEDIEQSPNDLPLPSKINKEVSHDPRNFKNDLTAISPAQNMLKK